MAGTSQLILAHRGIVHRLLQRLKVARCVLEDAEAEGMLALVKAASTFDASKGAFSTYAWYRIEGHLKDWMTAQNRRCPSRVYDGTDWSSNFRNVAPEPVEWHLPAELDPESDVDLQLHVVLVDASPELAGAAQRALGLMLSDEFGPEPGVDSHRKRRARITACLSQVREIAAAERFM